jgi:hypothetical protein
MGQSYKQPSANDLVGRARVERSYLKRPASILLMIYVILMVVGCSSANEEPSNEPVLPTVEAGEPGGPGGLLVGELMLVNRCLYLVNPSGVRWLPVFYEGTVSWERGALVLYGQRFEVGERLWVGGGEGAVPGNFRFLQAPHDSCDTRNVWMHISTADRTPPNRSSP